MTVKKYTKETLHEAHKLKLIEDLHANGQK